MCQGLEGKFIINTDFGRAWVCIREHQVLHINGAQHFQFFFMTYFGGVVCAQGI